MRESGIDNNDSKKAFRQQYPYPVTTAKHTRESNKQFNHAFHQLPSFGTHQAIPEDDLERKKTLRGAIQ